MPIAQAIRPIRHDLEITPVKVSLMTMKPRYETDPNGAVWQLLPHEAMNGTIEDMIRARVPFRGKDGTVREVGMRQRVPQGMGTGHWDFLTLSPYIHLLIGNLEYHEDCRIEVPSDLMAKVRILLAGGLRQDEAGIRLEGAGAFVESYPGSEASSYVVRGGEVSRLVILNCSKQFFVDELGLDAADLPFPLSHLFEDTVQTPEGRVTPLGPDVLRAANDIMRASTRFAPPLLAPYLTAKAREIACAMIGDLMAAREAPAVQIRSTVRDVGRINEARDIILDRYQRPPAIAALAREVGVNQTKLKALFKATFGLTIHDLVQKCRMERAVDLLASSDLTVAEIAYAVGYDYPASFTNAFRKFYGHAPKQARNAGAGTERTLDADG